MCSVEGFTGQPEQFTIQDFAKLNKRRGPDDTTFYEDSFVKLGHNLLAISPNSTDKRQPWKMPDGRYLVWNGEIFGLPEGTFDTEWLADKLSRKGLKYFYDQETWMGAGVIYDPKKLTITLFRDHFGIKPLYWMQRGTELYFSSTTLPLVAALNAFEEPVKKDKAEFQKFQHNDRHCFGTSTPMFRIRRLSPGQIKTWSIRETKFISEQSFWGLDNKGWTLHANYNFEPRHLEDMFKREFEKVCNAPGIPKTISLSGGLDSTLIASLTKHLDDIDLQSVKYDTTVKDDETVNEKMLGEYVLAKKTAKKFDLPFHTTYIDYDINQATHEGQFALGIPLWDRSRWVTRYLNIKAAAERGRKVYIGGDGDDELLTGYNGDYDYFARSKHKPYMDRHILKEYAKNDPKWGELRRITPWWIMGDDLINNRLFLRMLAHVDSFCTGLDHLCGHFGMESRVPFLSQKLAKYIMNVPSTYKLHVPFEITGDLRHQYKGHYKGMIRDHMKQHLPLHVRKRHHKIGFATPWNARDDKRNRQLAQQDWLLLKFYMDNYYRFDVDFNNDIEDNLTSNGNHSTVKVDLTDYKGE